MHHTLKTHVHCRTHQPFTTGMEEKPLTDYSMEYLASTHKVLSTYCIHTHTPPIYLCHVYYPISSVCACIPHICNVMAVTELQDIWTKALSCWHNPYPFSAFKFSKNGTMSNIPPNLCAEGNLV
jgi:hypothetical protein